MSGKSLKDIFTSFANGKPEMESKQFAKMMKECGLQTKSFNAGICDIVFGKVKTKGSKVITFEQFSKALDEVAKETKKSRADVEAKILSHGGATYAGTKADYVKFHDDKSTYTGVYARGGPTTVDAGRGGLVSDISQICDRTKADVRGVKK